MSWKYAIECGLTIGAATILLGTAALARTGSPSTKSADEPRIAARLLRDIKTDAVQVQSAASELEHLTRNSGATWLEYDRQWNEIKPAQEDMDIKLWRLESMQAKLSPAEREELEKTKPMIERIQSRTRELRALLDKPGVSTTDSTFKVDAVGLRNDARNLENAASAS